MTQVVPSRPPVVGEFYRLPESRKLGQQGYYHRYQASGIYVVTDVDNSDIHLRLVSGDVRHLRQRVFIKKSKVVDKLSHADFKTYYSDDVVSFLKDELEAIHAEYRTILGSQI